MHYNVVGCPRTFKPDMQVPGDGKERFLKNKNKTHIFKTWEKITNPDTIELEIAIVSPLLISL